MTHFAQNRTGKREGSVLQNQWIEHPHIPTAPVCLIAVSGRFPEVIRRLRQRGIEVLSVPPFSRLAEPVQSHADMLLYPAGGRRIITVRGYDCLDAPLRAYGFEVQKTQLSADENYPRDCLLNTFCLAGHQFFHPAASDPSVLEIAKMQQAELLPVKQGYTKCSCAILSEHAMLTTDRGIYNRAVEIGIDALLIDAADIILPGYANGLIGGCCCLLDAHTAAFTGSIQMHRNYKQIKTFLDRQQMEIVSLCDGPLIDIGGMIPLLQSC